MKTRQACSVLAFCGFASMALLPRQAEARACSGPADCPMGYACGPGGVAADGGPAEECVPLPCQSNSDCGPGLACYLVGYGLSVPADVIPLCDAGTMCSACAPQWKVPCTAASDCGPGFTCPSSITESVSCGKDQQPDASEPPYVTVAVIPCSAVTNPLSMLGDAALGAPFPNLSICEAGTTCTKVSWNTCVAEQTGPCVVDSDCPSTWTCGCQATCGGGGPPRPPGAPAIDAGCTMGCIPPSSDLVPLEVCNGGASFGAGAPGAPSSSGASDSGAGAAGPGASPGAAGSSGGHGGCQIGSDRADASWMLVAAGVLAWARWRPRKPREATR